MFFEDPPVVTGLGVATSIGNTISQFKNNLERGISGIRYVDGLVGSLLPKKAYLVEGALRYTDSALPPSAKFGLHAISMALDDSFLFSGEFYTRERIGAVLSSSKGDMHAFDDCIKNKDARSSHFRYIWPHAFSTVAANTFNLSGPLLSTVTACATGTHSLISGCRLIQQNDADAVIVCVSDASVTPCMLSAYDRMRVYSRDHIRPFDKDRSGFIIGEGAGCIILERQSCARKRGAHIYGKVGGYISAQDTGTATDFSQEAAVLSYAIQMLLEKTRLSAYEIDLVNLHATGTLIGDVYEAIECQKVFAPEKVKTKFNALKPFFGHMLGASGIVETIACILGLYNNVIYPTLNVKHKDPCASFDLNCNRLIKKRYERTLKISMGFGGQIGLLLLEN